MSARLECNIKTDTQQALWNWFKLSSQCLQRWLSFAWTGRLLPYAPATCIFACMWKWRWSGDESMFYERCLFVCLFVRVLQGRVVENISKRCGGFLRKLSLRGCLGVGDSALRWGLTGNSWHWGGWGEEIDCGSWRASTHTPVQICLFLFVFQQNLLPELQEYWAA